MANTLVQFRADEDTKKKAARICEKLGIDLPTYFRMCMARIVQEEGIPFDLKIGIPPRNKGIELMRKISKRAEKNGISNMTLEEINTEISEARKTIR